VIVVKDEDNCKHTSFSGYINCMASLTFSTVFQSGVKLKS